MILHRHDLTLRPITGPDELDLFNGCRTSSTMRSVATWLPSPPPGMAVARPAWRPRGGPGRMVVAGGDLHPPVMDIFDIDGGTDDGVHC